MRRWWNAFKRAARVVALAVALTISVPPPANALVVSAPIVEAINSIMHIWNVMQDFLNQHAASWTAAIDVATAWIHEQINFLNLETEAINNRADQEAKQAMEIAEKHSIPKEHDFCARARAAKIAQESSELRSAARRAYATLGFRSNDLAAVASDIKARMELGLVPCNQDQPEASVHIALKCDQNRPPWGDAFERADMSSEAIFGYDQFPMPPNYKLPAAGNPIRLPEVRYVKEKHMPFVAALSFCQRISERFPAPPQNLEGKATMSDLAVDSHEDAQAAASVAYTTCMSLLEERIMYGDDLEGDKYKLMHDLQAKACDEDVRLGFLDGDPDDPEAGREVFVFADGSQGTCKKDGRSEVKFFKDYAFRLKSRSFESKYLSTFSAELAQAKEDEALRDSRFLYRDYIKGERELLSNALAQAAMVKMPKSTSDIGSMTKK